MSLQLNRRGLKPTAFLVVYNSDSMLSVVFLTNLLSVLQSVIFLECFQKAEKQGAALPIQHVYAINVYINECQILNV